MTDSFPKPSYLGDPIGPTLVCTLCGETHAVAPYIDPPEVLNDNAEGNTRQWTECLPYETEYLSGIGGYKFLVDPQKPV